MLSILLGVILIVLYIIGMYIVYCELLLTFLGGNDDLFDISMIGLISFMLAAYWPITLVLLLLYKICVRSILK